MTLRLEIKGSPRAIRANLYRFEKEFEADVIRSALPQWRNLVVQRAKRTRSFIDRTGQLRRNMYGRVDNKTLSVGFASGARSRQGAPYWWFLERGTRNGIRARHYWRDAIRRSRPDLQRLLTRAAQMRR